LAALIWGVKTWLYSRSHESTDNAQVDGHIIPVLAKVGGYITRVSVQDNDSVRTGDTLARIDDADYKLRLQQAEADLAAAQAAVGGRGTAQAAVATATGQRSALDAQIAAARANEANALSNLARMQQLVKQQIVSAQQLDAAQAAADAATANRQALERQATAAGGTVENAQAGVRLAQARLAAAQAARDNAALQLSYTVITAPASGTIYKKLVEIGQLVQPGQTLMSVVADTGVWITANYKETQLTHMRVGQPVEFDVDAYPGCVAEGKVQSLSGATGARGALLPPDNATGNFTKVVQRVPVRIAITKGCGPTRPLRQGMSVVTHVEVK
jgi:membrane fusion protein (multidrug efflux system)